MEVIVCPTRGDAAALAADAIERLVGRNPEAVLGPGHRLQPPRRVRRAGPPGPGRHPHPAPCARLPPRRVRRTPAWARPELPIGDPPRSRQPGRSRSRRMSSGLTATRPTWHGSAPPTRKRSRSAGGVDLQLLGVGTDGHLAFNEPGSSLASRTRIKTLTTQTREDNARFFGGDPDAVPRHCLTQGIGTILEARHLVLIASGRSQGRSGATARGGPGVGELARDSAAAAPPRDGAGGPRSRLEVGPPRPLRRDLRGQTGLAGPVAGISAQR